MKEIWNERYSQKEYIYGRQPNEFLKTYLDNYIPGTILLPAEGEGRNAVYAAQMGWKVYALDFSEEARKKALEWARESQVEINYEIVDLTQWQTQIDTDVIALIYAHFSPDVRQQIHKNLIKNLKPGGTILLEAFSKKQIEYDSGGPSDPDLLYNVDILKTDFEELKIDFVQERIIELSEGRFHQGDASVIRMIAKKTQAF
jgi:SAM-dependent methyltransferase